MGCQRINLSAVDFSQEMLISGHSAQFSVPVGFSLNTTLFPVQLEKTRIREMTSAITVRPVTPRQQCEQPS